MNAREFGKVWVRAKSGSGLGRLPIPEVSFTNSSPLRILTLNWGRRKEVWVICSGFLGASGIGTKGQFAFPGSYSFSAS